MVRIVGLLTREMSELASAHDLNLARLEVLLCLHLGEGINQQQLSERLLVTKGNICMTLQAMEEDSLIERRSDPTDQRVHRLYLSDGGRRKLSKILPIHGVMLDKAFDTLEPAQRRTLCQLLGRIEQTFEEMAERGQE
jgi:MarR family 2-MHQ and catechol resistance regulon transcriptional repressor